MSQTAIQVLRSIDAGNENKKIQLIRQDGLSIEDVFLQDDVKNLQIMGISIYGDARIGKSTLLNLLIRYLENEGHDGWNIGSLRNCFQAKRGDNPITKGIWIYPKIFKMKNYIGDEVGIILIDNEGLSSVEGSDGEDQMFSGLSAVLSYWQLFNIPKRMLGGHFSQVIHSAVTGIDELQKKERKALKEHSKLMFIVRNWRDDDEHPFGLEGGENYMQQKQQLCSPENKKLLDIIHETYKDIKCFLLPDPGLEAEGRTFDETKNLSLLREEFLYYTRQLAEWLFNQENLTTPANCLTGQDFYNILINIDGMLINAELSYCNVFTDYKNSYMVKNWIESFPNTCDSFDNLKKIKSEMIDIFCLAERKLSGKSQDKYRIALKQVLEKSYNIMVIKLCNEQYTNLFEPSDDIEKKHEENWNKVKDLFHEHTYGDATTVHKAYISLAKESASYYYKKLRKKVLTQFILKCQKFKEMDECVGFGEEEGIRLFKEAETFTCESFNNEELFPFWLKEYYCLRKNLIDFMFKKIASLAKVQEDILRKLHRKQFEHFECFTLLNNNNLNSKSLNEKVAILSKQVGYGLYGLPPSNASSRTAQEPSYSKKQTLIINSIVKNIVTSFTTSTSLVEFSCIYVVYALTEDIVNVPLFRVENYLGVRFIDSNCREYRSLNDFLNTNTLPDVLICYPLHARYVKSEGLLVGFSLTPASKTIKKCLNTADNVNGKATILAGLAGVGAACGLTVLAPAAVVGAGVCGIYGLYRGIEKIRDKKKHKEPVTGKDMLNIAAHSLNVAGGLVGVVGKTMGTVADATITLGSRVFAGITSGNAFLVSLTSTTQQELISLIAQDEDTALKMLFYFGSKTFDETLALFRTSLNLNDNSKTGDTLLALMENNCIQFAYTHESNLRFEKYISDSMARLVKNILAGVNATVKNIVLKHRKIEQELIKCDGKRSHTRFTTIESAMKELMIMFENEMAASEERFKNLIPKSSDVMSFGDVNNFKEFQNKLDRKNGDNFVLAFHHLFYSLVSELGKANNFFNNIEHQAIHLPNFYVYDVLCHPICEVSQQVKEMVEQKESAVDLSTSNVDGLHYFLQKVLEMLRQNCDQNWSFYQFEESLKKITSKVIKDFRTVVGHHQIIVKTKKDISCLTIKDLIKNIGMEGYNYGLWVSQFVIDKICEDEQILRSFKELTQNDQEENGTTITPAWNGVLDNFFYYHSSTKIEDKYKLIKKIENFGSSPYSAVLKYYDLTFYNSCVTNENVPSVLVYSEPNNESDGERGFIMFYLNQNNQS